MIRLQLRGEYDAARKIHHRYIDLFSLLCVDGNPAGVKAMLREMDVQNLNAQQISTLLIQKVRMEYDHNLSQQIYISTPVWNKVSDAKDDIIDIINAVAGTFDPSADSLMFAEALLTAAAEKPVVQQAMALLKADVQKLY